MTSEQIEELSELIQMRPGHKVKFPSAIRKGREEMQKLEKENREEEKEQRKMEKELANIERQAKIDLAQANAQQSRKAKQIDVEGHSKATTHSSTAVGIPVTTATMESKVMDLPAAKSYAAFISHKKAHSKHGEISETIAIRLKVSNFWCVLLCAYSHSHLYD